VPQVGVPTPLPCARLALAARGCERVARARCQNGMGPWEKAWRLWMQPPQTVSLPAPPRKSAVCLLTTTPKWQARRRRQRVPKQTERGQTLLHGSAIAVALTEGVRGKPSMRRFPLVHRQKLQRHQFASK